MLLIQKNTKKPFVVIYIKWDPPDPGWVILNTNVAVRKNELASRGWVLRNNNGNWLGGFFQRIGQN